MIEAIGLVRLDGALLATDEVSIKDINQLATPFMLNAALPSAFIQALQHGQKIPQSIKVCICIFEALKGKIIGHSLD